MRVAVLAPFLIASVVLAAAYGSSFLLPDYLLAIKLSGISAGSIMSAGMVATIVCASTAGWFAQRYGVVQTASLAAFMMAAAMLCRAAVPLATPLAYLGGAFTATTVLAIEDQPIMAGSGGEIEDIGHGGFR